MKFSRPFGAVAMALAAISLLASCASDPDGNIRPGDTREEALLRLQQRTGGAAVISYHKATGASRFLRLPLAARDAITPVAASTDAAKRDHSAAFFRDYGPAVGVSDVPSMRLVSTVTDDLGSTHLTWVQFHGKVPVFGATLKTHYDATDRLEAVTGTAIPDITVAETPTWSRDDAAQVARASAVAEHGSAAALAIGRSALYVYRTGLAQGIPGEDHLAWEIEVTDGAGIRDLVYVGAHTGKVLDRITGIHDDLFRRAYDGRNLPNPPPNYPSGAYWREGQRFPTASVEANNMIISSGETYGFFRDNFDRDSFDGEGGFMDAIFNRGYDCPNASWNGTFISFCPGLTTDDVTAHEWGHAYTQYTHGLIYAWQPGALNESYSDIWGETIDLINGRGTDAPGAGRSAAGCSSFSPPVGQLQVTAPAAIAGSYFAQSAGFGPALTTSGISGTVVAGLDAADAAGPSTVDGCSPLTNAAAVAGNVALIQRGSCEFSRKVLNAQNAGAIAVIIDNNAATGLPGMGPGVDAPSVTIPSLGIQQATGAAIRAQLGAGTPVAATLVAQPGTDVSYRWLMGEDAATLGGAIRDMSNPTCYSNPGKVSDTAYYVCSTADEGGVHTNSGVPNHGYALLVDGGTYNGHTIAAIGLTKAAHIYFRAQTVYQVQDSDFADHADALEASCADLLGSTFPALAGDTVNGPVSADDCAQVASMIAAVELRTPPTFCNFPPLLNPATVAQCSVSTTSGTATPIQSFSFETEPTDWTVSRSATSPTFTPRDWSWTDELPDAKGGSGFFAPDPRSGTCTPAADESGVLHLTSPEIVLPADTVFARATFEHWFATEPAVDGGNLKVSVNGGPWQLVPPGEVTFNNYIALLLTAEDGNTNPLAGQPAWTGTNPGTVNDGSWGRTHVNLGNFARAGDRIRLRWDFGTDGCGGVVGWYLDNVDLFSCTPNVPDISVADIAVAEGNAGDTPAVFSVTLSRPTIVPIAVSFRTVEGTAKHGTDFAAAEGTVVIPAGGASAQVTVLVKGNVVAEPDETFTLQLVSASSGVIVDGEAQATITNDD